MTRYAQLVKRAADYLDEYDLERSRLLLDLAKTRREVFGLSESAEESATRQLWADTDAEYPVPHRHARRPGAAGCGQAGCTSCYRCPVEARPVSSTP